METGSNQKPGRSLTKVAWKLGKCAFVDAKFGLSLLADSSKFHVGLAWLACFHMRGSCLSEVKGRFELHMASWQAQEAIQSAIVA